MSFGNPEIKLRKPLNEILAAKIHPFSFEVGVLRDKPHKKALASNLRNGKFGPGNNLKSIAGGPARKTGRGDSGLTISQVGAKARKQLGINYLTKPFKGGSQKNRDVLRMMNVFWALVFDEGKLRQKKRLENTIQAVVRNPLTRADYGRNKKLTQKIKGSSKKFIDTGQLFRAITARVRVNRVSK